MVFGQMVAGAVGGRGGWWWSGEERQWVAGQVNWCSVGDGCRREDVRESVDWMSDNEWF